MPPILQFSDNRTRRVTPMLMCGEEFPKPALMRTTEQAGRLDPEWCRRWARHTVLTSAAGLFSKERDVVFTALVGGFADNRRVRGFDCRYQQLGIDLSAAEVGVTVATRARFVLRIVAVHQVDPAGDGLDAIYGMDQ